MRVQIKNIAIPITSFWVGFGLFWYVSNDAVRDMREINTNTIQIMQELEGLMGRMVNCERGKLEYMKSLAGLRYEQD